MNTKYTTAVLCRLAGVGWLQSVGSMILQVSFAKESYKREYILQKGPIVLSILLTEATPFHHTATVTWHNAVHT